jgi:hypothetical protein
LVDLPCLRDLGELLHRNIGRFARLPPQDVEVGSVVEANETDVEEPGELLLDLASRAGRRLSISSSTPSRTFAWTTS